ncbi:MAG: glycosyltransferase family A protein [Xanthobacteraceae bacterium]
MLAISDQPFDASAREPLFSVIIPLEFHRGQWERAWQGWQAQTLDSTAFEIILVVPPAFPDRDKLHKSAGSQVRLEYSQDSHDIDLCAVGAAKARGRFLFFTESHCWPEPDVLELCLEAFRVNEDWAALSCRSVRVTHNRLSEAEADMYEADIAFGMYTHPWRKILDQCFVTRREAYRASGGLKPEFGHFSEWLLAANYFQTGCKIGYLPEARLHHYYVGSLDELREFTLDFVAGEIRYFAGESVEPGDALLERPSEWVCRHSLDRMEARGILSMVARDGFTVGTVFGVARTAQALARWGPIALLGDRLAIAARAFMVLWTGFILKLSMAAGPRRWLAASFKKHTAALIAYERLIGISRIRLEQRDLRRDRTPIAGDDSPAVLEDVGFHPGERRGESFRWSEPEALLRLCAPGCSRIRVQCLRVRRSLRWIDLRVYLNGERVASSAITIGTQDFEIAIEPPLSGIFELGWSCRPLFAITDPRRLGIPVIALDVTTQDAAVDARSGPSGDMRGSAGAATTQRLRQHRLLLAR